VVDGLLDEDSSHTTLIYKLSLSLLISQVVEGVSLVDNRSSMTWMLPVAARNRPVTIVQKKAPMVLFSTSARNSNSLDHVGVFMGAKQDAYTRMGLRQQNRGRILRDLSLSLFTCIFAGAKNPRPNMRDRHIGGKSFGGRAARRSYVCCALQQCLGATSAMRSDALVCAPAICLWPGSRGRLFVRLSFFR